MTREGPLHAGVEVHAVLPRRRSAMRLERRRWWPTSHHRRTGPRSARRQPQPRGCASPVLPRRPLLIRFAVHVDPAVLIDGSPERQPSTTGNSPSQCRRTAATYPGSANGSTTCRSRFSSGYICPAKIFQLPSRNACAHLPGQRLQVERVLRVHVRVIAQLGRHEPHGPAALIRDDPLSRSAVGSM